MRIQAGKNLSSFIEKAIDKIGSFLQKPTITKDPHLQQHNLQTYEELKSRNFYQKHCVIEWQFL